MYGTWKCKIIITKYSNPLTFTWVMSKKNLVNVILQKMGLLSYTQKKVYKVLSSNEYEKSNIECLSNYNSCVK